MVTASVQPLCLTHGAVESHDSFSANSLGHLRQAHGLKPQGRQTPRTKGRPEGRAGQNDRDSRDESQFDPERRRRSGCLAGAVESLLEALSFSCITK
jgi:hypothetical protein